MILVGEMRDLETISLAITAAEMGALVFGTLHTNGAANTIDRLIDAFPADEQAQIRTTLAESLAGIVSQLLLRTADGQGRVAVNEILLKTPGLPNVIREGNTPDDPLHHPGRPRPGHAVDGRRPDGPGRCRSASPPARPT